MAKMRYLYKRLLQIYLLVPNNCIVANNSIGWKFSAKSNNSIVANNSIVLQNVKSIVPKKSIPCISQNQYPISIILYACAQEGERERGGSKSRTI